MNGKVKEGFRDLGRCTMALEDCIIFCGEIGAEGGGERGKISAKKTGRLEDQTIS